MSKLGSAGRKLNQYRVSIARGVQRKKQDLALQMVTERVKTDAEFAKDIIKIIGELQQNDIRKNILDEAKKTVLMEDSKQLAEKWEKTELVDGKSAQMEDCILIESKEQQLVETQLDGGKIALVEPTQLPEFPTDGNK